MYHPIKEKNMQALAAYQRQLWKNPKLTFLFFELTDRCNLNCMHCGSSCLNTNVTYIDFEVISRTLKEVSERYDPKQIMICVTGGEPMLHPDFIKVIAASHDLGFPVGITTNGTLIDEEMAENLKKAGLDTVAISIDGLEVAHDAFRRNPGAFRKAMQGVKALKRVGIEPQALTVIHKNNFDQLEDIYNFVKAEDFYSWRVVNMNPIGRAKEHEDLLLDGEQLRELYDFIRKKRFDPDNDMDVTYGCSHFVTYEYENELRDYYFQCGAGTKIASIRANGDIVACLDIERRPDLVQGNAYKDSFCAVWENRFERFRSDRTAESAVCKDCPHKDVCMGDSAHTWDYDTNEPLYCVSNMIGDRAE
ncbi:radical SAM additional 4Fe4S-binding SPASM domain-containing protein [Butyrivibrio sp. ob235]|uniref:radical SAM/SPASM domain-containing protein n=1 Tax=Butyrivibrio sp. ob235 TaxID=1761780 RepID=UPI0008B22DE9|nr:radical SAM protein [Butyrivibrio sp. ob235]SEM18333.1 radical SAM additional 4Fe4S-binding SPASM domain-containing protein [Butyrivibrio sp. ob235]